MIDFAWGFSQVIDSTMVDNSANGSRIRLWLVEALDLSRKEKTMTKPFFIPAHTMVKHQYAAVGYFLTFAQEMPSDCFWIVPGTLNLED